MKRLQVWRLLGVLTISGHALAQSPQTPPPTTAPPGAGGTSNPAAPPSAGPPSTEPVPAPEAPPAPTTEPPPPPPASTSVAPPDPPSNRSKIVERLEAGGWMGWGIQIDGQPGHPYGFTLGARGGAVLPDIHVYVGLMLGIFAGQKDSDYYCGTYRCSAGLWQSQVAVEGGYDLDFGPLTLRPYAGLGVNHTTYSATYGYVSYDLADKTSAYLSVGGMAHIKLTKRIYGGIDSRLVLATTSPLSSAIVVAASGGVMFF